MSQAHKRGGFNTVPTRLQALISRYKPVQRMALAKIQHVPSCLSRRARKVAPTLSDCFPTRSERFPTHTDHFPTVSRPHLLPLAAYSGVGVCSHWQGWTCFAVGRKEQQQ